MALSDERRKLATCPFADLTGKDRLDVAIDGLRKYDSLPAHEWLLDHPEKCLVWLGLTQWKYDNNLSPVQRLQTAEQAAHMGCFMDALRIYQNLREHLEGKPDVPAGTYASTVVGIAEVYVMQQIFVAAKPLLDGVLSEYSQSLGPDHRAIVKAKALLQTISP